MDLEATTALDAAPERVYDEVADLSTYPAWLGIVLESEPDGDGAWYVELGARLGPVKAGKRVRMARTTHDRPSHARFERAELDDEEHSSWVLDATVSADAVLTMRLHYGGDLWLPMMDKILQGEVDKAGARLAERLA